MPTIIDSLLVTLGLDSSSFSAGKAKVDRGLKDTGSAADKTSASVKNVAAEAAKLFAIIGGTAAIRRFVEQTIESSAALDRFSRNLGESTDTVSAWSNAAEVAGGSAAGLQGTLDMLSKAQTELQLTGQSALIPYFASLGVSLADVSGKARPTSEILLSLADRFAGMDRTTANNMGRMMGIDPGTMNLLLRGRSEVELMIRRQKEYGAVSKQQAEEASRVRDAMVQSRQSFEAFGRELVSQATPAILQILDALSKAGAWMRENKEFVQSFLTILAAGLAAVGVAAIPINATLLAVTGLAAALALLWQDYQTWKSGGDSLFDWAMWNRLATATEGWHGVILALAAAFLVLGKNILSAGAAAIGLGGSMGKLGGAAGLAGKAGAVGLAGWGGWEIGSWLNENAVNPLARKLSGGKYGSFGDWLGANPQLEADAAKPVAGARKQSSESAAMSYFQSQGWSKEQAAGIVANLKRESAFNVSAVGDSGKAYGLAQWHPDRQAEFQKLFGKSIVGSTLQEQLAFVQHELTAGNERAAGSRLRLAQNAADAARVVSQYYERPKDVAGEAGRRAALATSIISGIPGASALAANSGAAVTARASAPVTAGSSSVETHIGEVKVYTAATDAAGIARDMGAELDYLFTSQANSGIM